MRRSVPVLAAIIMLLIMLALQGDAEARHRPPTPTPTPVAGSYPLHTGIVSTTFFVGEIFNAHTTDGSQVCSTYDAQWAYHWGGVNEGTVSSSAPDCAGSVYGSCDGTAPSGPTSCRTEKRTAVNGYFPSQAHPLENPFYLDLPYDDLNNSAAFKDRCSVVPWARVIDPSGAHCKDGSFSYMKNRWVAITGPNGATCYGQIEDAGPFVYNDEAYVFGTARPKSKRANNAGLDVSPALNSCLGFKALNGDSDRVSWRFIDDKMVPSGPWRMLITTSGVTN